LEEIRKSNSSQIKAIFKNHFIAVTLPFNSSLILLFISQKEYKRKEVLIEDARITMHINSVDEKKCCLRNCSQMVNDNLIE